MRELTSHPSHRLDNYTKNHTLYIQKWEASVRVSIYRHSKCKTRQNFLTFQPMKSNMKINNLHIYHNKKKTNNIPKERKLNPVSNNLKKYIIQKRSEKNF